MAPVVSDNPEQSRYEIHVDGELAGFAEYKLHGDHVTFTHTEVDDAYEGQGLAGRLTEQALVEAREDGLAVVPTCPYVAKFIARNPEYVDLVPEDRRARHGL